MTDKGGAAPSLSSSSEELVLTVIVGEEKGVAYKLMGAKISLGRAPDNDLVINDAKASRNHALIERRPKGVYIRDLESKTGVILNGHPTKESLLKEGDSIQIGETVLRFGAAKGLSLAGMPPVPQNFGAPPPAAPPFAATSERSYGRRDKNPFVIIIIVGLGLALILLTQTKKFATKKITLKDESSFDQQIEGSDQYIQQQQQAIVDKGKDTQQYTEAQGFYLRGFREYREGNFTRAIQDFEAALALYPQHPLARRYLERSQIKNKEFINGAMERGEKNFNEGRYMNAFSEYRTVLLMTNDPKNKNYQLAQKRIETIQLILTNNR